MSKQLTDFDCGYIGKTYVDVSMEDVYRGAVDTVLNEFGDKAVVEHILHVLARDESARPAICDLSGFGWYEIDTPDELRDAEEKLKKDKNFIRP